MGLCGVPEASLNEAAAKLARWTKGRVTWTVTGLIPPFAREQLVAIYAAAWRQWQEVCGIELVYQDGPGADVVMGAGFIDGPGRVLAWSELPDGSDRPLSQRYDSTEDWDEVMALGVACHEGGHALGLPHGPEGNLMAPYFTRDVISPQSWDVAQMVKRYGPPAGTPAPPVPPPAPPAPPGGGSRVSIVIDFDKSEKVELVVENATKITVPGYKVLPV